MRALMLFDPLMGKVPQITPPCPHLRFPPTGHQAAANSKLLGEGGHHPVLSPLEEEGWVGQLPSKLLWRSQSLWKEHHEQHLHWMICLLAWQEQHPFCKALAQPLSHHVPVRLQSADRAGALVSCSDYFSEFLSRNQNQLLLLAELLSSWAAACRQAADCTANQPQLTQQLRRSTASDPPGLRTAFSGNYNKTK